MVDNAFDLRLFKAKNHIDDALGVAKRGQRPMQPPPNPRMPNIGPVPNQQPTNIPGNPQLTPQGVAVSGQQQVGPGIISGGAMVGPQGFEGGGVNYGMPVAGGQFNVGASMDPNMELAQVQAQYENGPFSVGAQYQPGGGVSGSVGYRQAFAKGGLAVKKGYQEGGLASSLPNAKETRDADVEFLNTRNLHLRDVAGLPRAKGGAAWTRKEGKNPEGGLNAKGRASLKAQGHDIKPPVSAKQAKKSPKAAARRKSFCARMSGMPGPMEDDKGRPTRKALSLRKWDC